jgi:hypothetical protein
MRERVRWSLVPVVVTACVAALLSPSAASAASAPGRPAAVGQAAAECASGQWELSSDAGKYNKGTNWAGYVRFAEMEAWGTTCVTEPTGRYAGQFSSYTGDDGYPGWVESGGGRNMVFFSKPGTWTSGAWINFEAVANIKPTTSPNDFDDCKQWSGWLCLYANSADNPSEDNPGYRFKNPVAISDLRILDFDDKLSSWGNFTGQDYCWYDEINFKGTSMLLRGNNDGRGWMPDGKNDIASSLRPALTGADGKSTC